MGFQSRPKKYRTGLESHPTFLRRSFEMSLRPSLAAILLLSPISFAIAANDDPATRQVELKKGDKIIFFGDSLANLAGEEKPKEHVKRGYVNIVREKLHEKHKDKNFEVDWVATGGYTVPNLINRVDKDGIAK